MISKKRVLKKKFNKEKDSLKNKKNNNQNNFSNSNTKEFKFKPYPEIESPDFYQEIYEKKEFRDSEIHQTNIHDESSCHPGQFNLSPFQSFLKNYISMDTPYNGVLVMYSTGVGKTCAAISIAEGFKKSLKQMGKRILVLTTLRKNFENELFNFKKEYAKKPDEIVQCTGKEYELTKDTKFLSQQAKENEIKRMIKTYYQFYGYQKFANHVIKETNGWDGSEEKINEQILKYIHKEFDDRVIIIDEVHNIKTDVSEEWKKSIQPILLSIVRHAKNTKLVLMSATPMFDRSDEIIFILNLLLANDGREEIKKTDIFNRDDTLKDEAIPLLRHLLKGYVSYARGERPMVFPFRLSPADAKIPYVEYDMNGQKLGEDDKIKFTKLVECEMKGIQNNTYMYYLEKNRKKLKLKNEVENLENVEENIDDEDPNKQKMINSNDDTEDELLENNSVPNNSIQNNNSSSSNNNKNISKFNSLKNQPKSLLTNLTYISTIVYPTLYNPDDIQKMNKNNNMSNNEMGNMRLKKISAYGTYGKDGIDNDSDNGLGGFYKVSSESGKKKVVQYKYQKHAIINGTPFIDEKHLNEYSSKFAKILFELKRAQGLCFVYSRFVDDGILPLALMLEQNGFERYTSNDEKRILDEPVGVKRNRICYKCSQQIDNPVHHNEKLKDYHNFRQAKYIIFFGEAKDIIQITKEEALDKFSSKTNFHGEDIKVFLGTKTVSEGLDFKRIRQVHILQPWFNLSRHEQIIGRAIRNCSHIALPKDERNVEIFQYAATLNENTKGVKKHTESIDLKHYSVAESKDRIIKKIMRILKQSAVDCNFFKKHNIIDTDEKIKQKTSSGQELTIKVKDEPFSQMCDYEENCNFDCAWIKDPHKHYPINTDTYNLKFGTQDINLAKRTIKALFKKNNAFHLVDIEKYVHEKHPKMDRLFIFAALDDFVNNPKQETVIDKFQRKGYIIYRGDYYIFQPVGYKEDLPMIYREKPSNKKPDRIDLEQVEVDYDEEGATKVMNMKNKGMDESKFKEVLVDINDKLKKHKTIQNNNKYDEEFNNAVYGSVIDKLSPTDFIDFLKLLISEYLIDKLKKDKKKDEKVETFSKKYYIYQFINYLHKYFINYYSIQSNVSISSKKDKNKVFYIGFHKDNNCYILKGVTEHNFDIEKLDLDKIEFEKCNHDIIHKLKQLKLIELSNQKEKNKDLQQSKIMGYIDGRNFKIVDNTVYTGAKTSKGEFSKRSIPKGRVCSSIDAPVLKKYHEVLNLSFIGSAVGKSANKKYLCENLEIYLRYKQNLEDKKNKPTSLYFFSKEETNNV